MDDKVGMLLEVLKFYGDPGQYKRQERSYMCHDELHLYSTYEILGDKGEKARQCLREFEEATKAKA